VDGVGRLACRGGELDPDLRLSWGNKENVSRSGRFVADGPEKDETDLDHIDGLDYSGSLITQRRNHPGQLQRSLTILYTRPPILTGPEEGEIE
jgi:hypothetical protein